jgi:ssDNA-specific exonuclease RecJ
MNNNILMLCYNEGILATELNNLLYKLEKNDQIDSLYTLFKNHNIQITKPDDIFIKYWNVGMHYCKPNFNIEKELQELKNNFNIEIIGEMVSKSHGWVNSAFSTVT